MSGASLLVAIGLVAVPAEDVLLTGSVRSDQGEAIYAPASNTSPMVLRYMIPEGSLVKPGDVLVRVDPGPALAQRESLRAQIAQARERAAKDVAQLRVDAIDAELALADAKAALDKAEIEAAVPREFLARIDFDRYQDNRELCRRELALKREAAVNAKAAIARREQDARFEMAKIEADLKNAEAMIAAAEQKASRAGVVVYGFDAWSGRRYQEGASAYSGSTIGEIVTPEQLSVRAYALEPDRRGLRVGQTVSLHFDAIPGRDFDGRIRQISGAPEPKSEWGRGSYFRIEIALPEMAGAGLLPGMSVRVRAASATTP